MASAAISAGASLLGGIAGGKGASKAAKIQAAAYQKGIDEQQREFGVVQANNQPYMQAGTTGLDAYLNLLGLGSGGSVGQASAISNLQASPLFTSQYQQGLDAINQSAAATGGLRGGNNALSESNFGANLLSSVIQNALGNYGGLISTGQAAASGTNSAALSTGNNISNLLGQQGSANATAAASPYAAFQQALSGIGSSGVFSGNTNAYGINGVGNIW